MGAKNTKAAPKKDFNRHPVRVFFSYFAPHRALFALDMACAAAVAVIDLIFPFASRQAMRSLLPEKRYTAFFVVIGILIAAYVVKGALYYVITVAGHYMGVLVEADMRRDVFTHMQDLSFRFFDRNRTGVLLICALTILGALAVMFTIRWELALVLLVLLPICFWYTLRQRKRMRDANIEVKKKTAEINAAIESGISGVRTAKAFAAERAEREKFDRANNVFKGAKRDYYRAMGLFQSGMEFTTGAMQAVVIGAGGLLIMGGTMDYVDLVTFTLYVSTFISPVRKLVMFMEQYMQGSAGFSRFLELMRTEPEIQDAPDAAALGKVKGDIRYQDVSFSYDGAQSVLHHVDLHIRAGERFALVGPSGGGKTTLCHLLPRFYDVTEGAVTVDGKDVRAVTQESLRSQIGIIQQDVFIFAGTIRDNIRYGRPDAADREVVEAAVRAEIHREIMELPQGYDTYVGERGVMLSGGQKQRLSIARVFLKNPPILILDEATSALDSVTEQRIQASLDRLSQGRTSLIIAHRLSTIRGADRIAVVEQGRIVELGSHDELMAKNGAYAALERAQGLAE